MHRDLNGALTYILFLQNLVRIYVKMQVIAAVQRL